jgi:hypothetical protein
MCPACLASIGMLVAAAAASAGAATAVVAAKIRSKQPEATTQPNGDRHVATENRVQG